MGSEGPKQGTQEPKRTPEQAEGSDRAGDGGARQSGPKAAERQTRTEEPGRTPGKAEG